MISILKRICAWINRTKPIRVDFDAEGFKNYYFDNRDEFDKAIADYKRKHKDQ